MIQLQPIGTVRNGVLEAHRDTRWDQIESEIVLGDEWLPALQGLEQFSHIWVIFYLDRVSRPEDLRVRPQQRDDMPLVGRLATRTPARPNPIGIAAVELIEVRGSRLRVRGLDALDGSPVLDVKPYLPRGDSIENARVAEWVEQHQSSAPARQP